MTNPKFHKLHYNFVAKRIKEQWDMGGDADTAVMRLMAQTNRAVLGDLAVSFARAFKKDNEAFDPLKFLDACVPDSDLYPLSEVWESEQS